MNTQAGESAISRGELNDSVAGMMENEIDKKLLISEAPPQNTNPSQAEENGQQSDDDCSAASDADNENELPQESFEKPDIYAGDHAAPGVLVSGLSDEFVCPDEELVAKIVAQMEYYFSDENIMSDTYLLKHIRRNKQGFVSIKVISSFRKMKKLTKDWRVIAFSVRKSEKLEINESGTKVKRIAPLPTIDAPPVEPNVDASLRTVVASNLPMENPTMENVVELFLKCGSIAQVRIIRQGSSVPPDVKKFVEKHLDVGVVSAFALVEYEDQSCAMKACKTLTNTSDWRKGMRVSLLSPPSKKTGAKDSKGSADDRTQDSDGTDPGAREKKKKKKKRNSRVMELAHGESPYSSSGSDLDRRKSPCRDGVSKASPNQGNKNMDSAGGSVKGMLSASPKSSPKNSPVLTRRSGNQYGRSPLAHDSENEDWRARSSSLGTELSTSPSQSQSPWVQRRLKAQQQQASQGGSPLLGSDAGTGSGAEGGSGGDFVKKVDSDRILRQPRGPDGTKGFRLDRVKLSTN